MSPKEGNRHTISRTLLNLGNPRCFLGGIPSKDQNTAKGKLFLYQQKTVKTLFEGIKKHRRLAVGIMTGLQETLRMRKA